MNSLFDTHTHLYAEEFDADRHELMQRSAQSGVTMHMLPNVDLATIAPLREMLKRYPTTTIGAMGLHPTSVDDQWEANLRTIRDELFSYPYHAVGEVGIDLYWDRHYLAQQKEAFARQIEWSLELHLPLIIHCREAFEETFDVLERYKNAPLKGVFHSFAGGEKEMHRALHLGDFLFGINGTVTFKKSSQRDLLPLMPNERIVLETDAPYMAPSPHRGKRNEPAYLNHLVAVVCSTLGTNETDLTEQLLRNSQQLFPLIEEKKEEKQINLAQNEEKIAFCIVESK